MFPLLVLVGILLPVSTIGRVFPVHGNVHTIPGVSQVAPGVAQVAPGVVGNPYANYYRVLISYYQSLYANRNQHIGNPLLNNQNVAIGTLRARQRVANLHNVDYNIFQKKKDDYKYQPTKHSNKYPDGHYKDKYVVSDYPEGTYKEHDKYPTNDKYPHDTIYQPGYRHDKHPKDYHNDPYHNKYHTDYPGDIYPDQKYKETYATGYPRDKYPKNYKGDKYPTDHYSNDKYSNEKYMGIHAYPHQHKKPHDYHTDDKYTGGKYKETYPNGHLHDKYPNGKKGDYYPYQKYQNKNYMGIHDDSHFDKYPIDKYPDGHYKGSQSDYPRDKYNDKHIRPNFHHSRRGGTDSLFEFGLPVSDVTGRNRRGDLIGIFDDVVGHPRHRSRAEGLFSGSIPDHSVGIGGGLLDLGPFSSRGRHDHINPTYAGKDFPIGEKYPGVQHKKHKYVTYHNKDYKYSTGHKYDTYPDYKDNKYRTSQKYDIYPYKDHKHTSGQKYDTYPKDYKYNTEQKYDTYPKKDYKYPKTHIGSVYPDHSNGHYSVGHYDSHKGLYGDMIHKKDYKVKEDTYKKVKSKKTY